MKRILTFLMALSVLLTLPVVASAHPVPDVSEECSIEVVVSYDDKAVDGGTLTAIKVGYVDENDGNYFFSQVITGEKLEDISSSTAPSAQLTFYNQNKDTYTFYTQTQSVEDGKALFSDLPMGLYLIVQYTAASGYSKMDPFLVTVPYLKNDTYVYDVDVLAKSELEREPEPTKAPPVDPGNKLPQTGQLNWPVPLMAVAGLALFTVGWVLYFGKKRDRYET